MQQATGNPSPYSSTTSSAISLKWYALVPCIIPDEFALCKFLEHFSLDWGLQDNEKVFSFQSCFVVLDALRFIVEDNIVIPHSPHLLHPCRTTGGIILVPLTSLLLGLSGFGHSGHRVISMRKYSLPLNRLERRAASGNKSEIYRAIIGCDMMRHKAGCRGNQDYCVLTACAGSQRYSRYRGNLVALNFGLSRRYMAPILL